MEDEARDILRTALSVRSSRAGTLVDSIRAHIEPLGGVELKIAPREAMREPVHLLMTSAATCPTSAGEVSPDLVWSEG